MKEEILPARSVERYEVSVSRRGPAWIVSLGDKEVTVFPRKKSVTELDIRDAAIELVMGAYNLEDDDFELDLDVQLPDAIYEGWVASQMMMKTSLSWAVAGATFRRLAALRLVDEEGYSQAEASMALGLSTPRIQQLVSEARDITKGNSIEFAWWMAQVDRECLETTGLAREQYADCDFASLFDQGVTSSEAARIAMTS